MPDDTVVEEWAIPAYKDVVEKADDSSAAGPPCTTCKGTGTIKDGHMDCPKCGGTGIQKALEFDDQFDTDAETFAKEFGVDLTVVEKGGQGSGEHAGHPFRGNGHTVASFQAGAHNVHGDENLSGHYHLAAAAANVAAGQRALAAGDHGSARAQMNEAARHAAWAARQHDTGPQLHQAAKSLYAAAHTAGDQAETAGKAANDAQSVDASSDPDGASMAGMRAQIANDSASAAASTAGSIVNGIRSAYGAAAIPAASSQAA